MKRYRMWICPATPPRGVAFVRHLSLRDLSLMHAHRATTTPSSKLPPAEAGSTKDERSSVAHASRWTSPHQRRLRGRTVQPPLGRGSTR